MTTYSITTHGSRAVIRNQKGESLYYGPIPLCLKALDEWEAHPLTGAQERDLIDAQLQRTQNTWARLLGATI